MEATLATTYYVRTDATGAGDGTGPGVADAYQTVADVNSGTFVAGDSILFRRGQTWVERLVPPDSGSSVSQITFGAYGTGARPIITNRTVITGSATDSNWTQEGATDVWWMQVDGAVLGGGNPLRVWLDGTEYREADAEDDADFKNGTTRWWWDTVSNPDRLWVYATENPADAYGQAGAAGIEGSVAVQFVNRAILIQAGASFLTFEELDLRGGIQTIILDGTGDPIDGLIFQDCDIARDGSVGVYIDALSDTNTCDNGIIRRCTIDSGMSLQEPVHEDRDNMNGVNFIAGVNSWEVYDNVVRDFYHSGLQISADDADQPCTLNKFHDNLITGANITYMRGVATAGVDTACQFNEFYNNRIENTTARNQIAGDFNSFYYNIIDTVTNSPMTGNSATAQGFSLEPLAFANCHDNKVYNNTIYNTEEEGIRIHTYTTETVVDNEVTNNIMMNCGNNSESDPVVDNIALVVTNDSDISDNIIKNNLAYTSGVTALFRYRGAGDLTVAAFNAAASDSDVISGNIGGDPLFVSPDVWKNFALLSDSPAIDAGIDVGLTGDFKGNPVPIGAGVDMGAMENPQGGSMANESTTVQHRNPVVVQEGGTVKSITVGGDGTTELAWVVKYETANATGTSDTNLTVPAQYAELIAASFTVLSPGSVTTSGNQAMALSDGTSELALNVTGDAESTKGTVITLTPQSVSNGKAITQAAAGTPIVLVNTETGTIGDGMHGTFRLVWAL